MSINEETLMAYADGELDPAARAHVERAMRDDPAIAERVAQHQALRADVFAAFAPVLEEPVPPRLLAAAMPAKVADLSAVRARSSWAMWGGMAAALVLGVMLGGLRPAGEAALLARADGSMAAGGALADALDRQPTGRGDRVQIALSFAAKDGHYCRSFVMGQAAGLACRDGAGWKVAALAETDAGASGDYRQAGSALPAAVLDAVDRRIAGAPLDAAAEQAARQRGWR